MNDVERFNSQKFLFFWQYLHFQSIYLKHNPFDAIQFKQAVFSFGTKKVAYVESKNQKNGT